MYLFSGFFSGLLPATLRSRQAYFVPGKYSHCERSEAIQVVENMEKWVASVI